MNTKSRKPMRFIGFIVAIGGLLMVGITGGGLAAVFAQTTNSNANTNSSAVGPTPTDGSLDPASPEVADLNQQIDQKRTLIEDLRRQTALYERNLEQTQNERISLQAELQTIEGALEQTQRSLKLTTTEIEKLQLEIQKVEREIVKRQEEIQKRQSELAELLRQVYQADQVSQLELVVQEQSFSGFFTRVRQLHELSSSVDTALEKVSALKQRLDINRASLIDKRSELDQKRQDLEGEQTQYTEQQDSKQGLVEAAKSSEATYQQLLEEQKREAAAIDSEITTLIQQVKDRLGARGEDISKEKPGKLSWPVDPGRGISAYYLDPTYPYKKIIGQHRAIDIRAYQGTPVLASADGVVAIARKLDWVKNAKGRVLRPAYNFVTIVHGDGSLATVYGHLSVVSVAEGQTVKRGDVIGRSGATPGTAGAGSYTTGPHLHFEVRVNGIPDDPMKYLPAL